MPGTISRGRGRRTMNEINMVPFIDVMLVLLIIFMVTAPMVTPSLIDLPSVGKAGRQPDKIIQVVINKDERLEVKGGDGSQQVSQRELAAAVKRAQGEDTNAPVVISADRNVKYETVVKAMDALQRAGVARVGLSVQLGQ
ncbi:MULTISPECIES: protein TolR [Pseudorhodoferax]|jgi:biopolymer transport protein TolR|uniref:Cell division and transport-associated protein TolR n=1 Tax=Pseudorhodoferax soli TaxID=545864 RepID=A0A368Y100_9BURK|nr:MULTISPECIES: protein TolR [Pseudorhodoferax]KQP03078.1 protein TolR [Pseudorhodoferax sp. Leaf265]PZP92604.1 MAG: protein TolR [Variovorax paradoxus]PZQ03107.1 MAG: protein TolR [Variovorax paradoxus]RCW73882.1 cell division and transport-associated protein TolR [Pseudorhodoferax soli]